MIIEDCAYCGHIKLRHGTGKDPEHGACNNCNKKCTGFMRQ